MNKKRILITAGIATFLIAVIVVVAFAIRNSNKHVDISGSSDLVVEATTDRYITSEFTTPLGTESMGGTSLEETEGFSELVTMPSTEIPTEAEKMPAYEATTPEITGKDEANDETRGHQETEKITTTHENTTATEIKPNADNAKEQHNYAEFTFIKYNIQGMPSNYNWSAYLERQGYKTINKMKDFNTFAKNLINNLPDTKEIKYIVTPYGLLDEVAEKEASDEYFLYEKLGLDSQIYLCKGISVFKLKKIQDVVNDVTNKSVYALYYYSYLDGNQIKEVDDSISEIVAGFTGNDYDKIKAAHDFLCVNVSYDESQELNVISHTAYGAIVKGVSVCEGYSKAFMLMLNAMGIQCNYVVSKTHAWNEILLDDNWYVIDVTNDDTNSCYCYFLIGKDVIKSKEKQIVDGFIISEDNIQIYGYIDGSNNSTVEISDTTYDSENRIRPKEIQQ